MTRTVTYVLACMCLLANLCEGFSPGLSLSLAAAGLVGLKLYLGTHLLGLTTTSLLARTLPNITLPDDDSDEDEFAAPALAATMPPHLETVRRHRRAAVRNVKQTPRVPGVPRLNPEVLDFFHEIDEDQCFEKFFCQLGADRKAFGTFGVNVALVTDLYMRDRSAWYSKAMALGRRLRRKERCPGKCESEDIKKTVKYLSKHLFN